MNQWPELINPLPADIPTAQANKDNHVADREGQLIEWMNEWRVINLKKDALIFPKTENIDTPDPITLGARPTLILMSTLFCDIPLKVTFEGTISKILLIRKKNQFCYVQN